MTSFKQVFTVTAMLMTLMVGQRTVLASCSEDFLPCQCSGLQSDPSRPWSIICNGVRAAEIKQILQRSARSVFSALIIKFSTLDSGETLPSDMLAGKVFVNALELTCPGPDHLLKIDPFTFGSTNNFFYLNITGCNMKQQPDFGFLTNFTMLEYFYMSQVTGFNSFRGLPSQSNLFRISITNSRDFESLDTAKVALPGLKELLLQHNDLTDFSAERALSALTSFSTDTLHTLSLNGNQLTVIPPSLHLITSLENVNLESNRIRVVGNGTLSFPATSNVMHLVLSGNLIEKVEPGAFTAGVAQIYLSSNSLTKFESDAFLPILKSLDSLGRGFILLPGNPFVCDCHLEWLIKDNRQYLLKYLNGPTCSNSTSFTDLIPGGYSDCHRPFTCTQQDGNYPAPEPCANYFYMCSNGNSYRFDCQPELVYNKNIQACDWPKNVPGC